MDQLSRCDVELVVNVSTRRGLPNVVKRKEKEKETEIAHSTMICKKIKNMEFYITAVSRGQFYLQHLNYYSN